MATLEQDFRLKISSDLTSTADLSTPESAIAEQYKNVTSNGTSTGQADLRWRDKERKLAGGANENLDLTGVLTDEYGAAVNFLYVKGIIIKNNNTTAGDNLLVGGGATPFLGWFVHSSDRLRVKAGTAGNPGIFYSATDSGWQVTAGFNDLLKLENEDATNELSFDIMIWGTSA